MTTFVDTPGSGSPLDHILDRAVSLPPRVCQECGNAEQLVPPGFFWLACATCHPETFTRN